MKFSLFRLVVILFFLTACAAEQPIRLPDLVTTQDQQGKQACEQFFPAGKWQFVHSIDFTMRNGAGSTVIGVTTLTGTAIESALITIEGLTLFEAVYHEDNSFEIRRAVPPFDKPGFAQGLMSDVRAIFQLPPGSNTQIGHLTDKIPVCRYIAANGKVTDILVTEDCLQINNYTPDLVLARSISGRSCRKQGSLLLPEHLELKTFAPTGYTLKMTLISADELQGSPQ